MRASDTLRGLLGAVADEARRAPFDICRDTYTAARRDPHEPILCAGNLDAPYCAVARELGKDEVLLGEPLIGMSGRRFRRAVHEARIGAAPKSERRFEAVLEHVLITNTVPYRPVGNRAYGRATKERFRPFVERLLAEHWTGDQLLALGQHAFLWFAPYAAPGEVADAWADREQRFDRTLDVTIRGKHATLHCLPHPSPLSPFKRDFAALLTRALG